ncbi:MAG TPA: glycosyltransferase family 4 protein [Pyrinomonadaceae bacterium]|nr:glycosyltransferase family 4 protein [Pyrinomonadaceae bacterium]
MLEKGRRIIYVWNYREWGGAQIYFLSLMKAAQQSYSVSALIPSDSDSKIIEYLDELAVPYDFLGPGAPMVPARTIIGKLSRRLDLLRSENRLVRQLGQRSDIDRIIVHADLGFWQSFLPLFRLSGLTHVFMTAHTGLPPTSGLRAWLWKLKGKTLSRRKHFRLIASNMEARQSLKPYLTPDAFDLVEVTYTGIDPDEIEAATDHDPGQAGIHERHSLPPALPLLMTVGQFITRKGCWVLLDCLRQLKASGREFMFVWLATSAPGEAEMLRIEGYGLGASLRIVTPREIGGRRELLSLLGTADLFVIASFQEGLPIALVEAMALGLPCVATRVNAIPEAIEDGVNGRLVAHGDANELASVIGELLDDPATRKTLGTAAKISAFQNFNAKTSAERTVKLYDEVWKTDR